MKKIIFVLALFLTMAFSANAQDGFFQSGDGGYRNTPGVDEPLIPSGPVSSIKDGEAANNEPLGDGLLVLTVLGAGYALSRRKKSCDGR